jgi:hypothetical protein
MIVSHASGVRLGDQLKKVPLDGAYMLLETDAVNIKFSHFVTAQKDAEKTVCDKHRKSNGIFLTNDAETL